MRAAISLRQKMADARIRIWLGQREKIKYPIDRMGVTLLGEVK